MIWFIHDSPSPGEYLLRCGMYTNIYIYITIQHTERLLHVENTSWDRHWYQHIHSLQCNQFTIVKSSRLIFVRGRLAQTGLPHNRTFRAMGLSAQHPQGFGSPPNIPLRLRETPYVRSTHFPLCVYLYAGLFYNKAALSHIQNTSSLYKNKRQTPWLHLPPQEATTRKGGNLLQRQHEVARRPRTTVYNLFCVQYTIPAP